MKKHTHSIGIIGVGNMGRAFTTSLLDHAVTDKAHLMVSERNTETALELRKKGLRTATNRQIAQDASLIILAVKPQDIHSVLAEIRSLIKNTTILVSIAAGIKIKDIEKTVQKPLTIIRSMPNTPAQIGQGITAWTANKPLRPSTKAIIRRIFSALGDELYMADESQLNAVTAVSGSGPAYFYYFTEALVAAGQNVGLSREQAYLLATKTFIGAAKLLESSQKTPEDLRHAVTSKGGTTEKALETLTKFDLWGILSHAVQAATVRAQELSNISKR